MIFNTTTGKKIALDLSSDTEIIHVKFVERLRSDFKKNIIIIRNTISDIKLIKKKLEELYGFDISKEAIISVINKINNN
jgi:archaellum component FlaD/FlaE